VLLNQSIQDLTQIYGQTAIFDHFVRNRLFWSRTFTGRKAIFIDVSVILPMRCLINQRAKLFPSRKAIIMHAQKSAKFAIGCKASVFFNLRQSFFQPLFEAIVFLR